MKAARWHGQYDVRIEDVPEPTPEPDQVKIKIDYCGICGTDIHEYTEGPMFIPEDKHPLTGDGPPLIIGHEYAGEIVETGSGITGWQVGDRVALEGYWVCFDCHYCNRHQYNRCENLAFHGLSAPGGLAEYVCAPTYQLYRVAPTVSKTAAALVEPVAVGVRAVNRVKPLLGETALIVGAGPIGLAILQVLHAAGVSRVAVLEPARRRREMAKKFGAVVTVDPNDVPLADVVNEVTNGLGFDMSFECAGVDAAFQASVHGTRKGARICLVSQTNTPFNLYVNDIGFAERDLIGTVAYCGDFSTAIELIDSRMVLAEEMITATLPLDDLVEVGYKELMENSEEHIKIIISPFA